MALDVSKASLTQSRSLSVGNELCGGVIGCQWADLLTHALLFVSTAVALLLVVFALSRLHDAMTVVEEERTRAHAEKRAFERFIDRLSGLDASAGESASVRSTGAGLTTMNQGGIQVQTAHSDGRLQDVKDAYRETVMAVPHYEEEYGESLETHLANEFGREVATAVTRGERFTPQMKQALAEKARKAVENRDALLQNLSREADALAATKNDLSARDRRLEELDHRPLSEKSFEDLQADWEQLDSLAEETESALRVRQQTLQDDELTRNAYDTHSFLGYVYQPLDNQYPILASNTAFLERIQAAQKRVSAALTRRV